MKRPPFTARQSDTPPKRAVCPLLNTMDRNGIAAAPQDYPSFENRCTATPQGDQIILTEQATFCLSTAHRSCPRFMAAAAADPERVATQGNTAHEADTSFASHTAVQLRQPRLGGVDTGFGDWSPDTGFPDTGFADDGFAEPLSAAQPRPQRARQWGWIGAAMIFVSTLMCGGIFAVYVGWQIANSSYMAVAPGTVDTLANPQPQQPQIYLVVTATSAPDEAAGPAQNPVGGQNPAQPPGSQAQPPGTGQLPQAVTPTPGGPGQIVIPPNGTDSQRNLPQTSDEPDGQPSAEQNLGFTQNGQNPAPVDPSLGALQMEIPTRRPTPILDIPTSTPGPEQMQEQFIPPPQPIGTPMVLLNVDDEILQTGECTTIRWTVENVRAVYFDSSGVDGHGQREVCMRDRTSNYVLTVMYPDGSPRYYTATIEFLEPTPTPSPTFTFTPEPYLTPTWTPAPPTATPTPNRHFAAHLASQGGNVLRCQSQSNCEMSLLVTNSGDGPDNLYVELAGSGAWSPQICRPDGVCGNPSLLISGIGPGNTALVRLVVNVPELHATQSYSYIVRALSEGSGRNVASNSLEILVEAGP